MCMKTKIANAKTVAYRSGVRKSEFILNNVSSWEAALLYSKDAGLQPL